MNIAYGTVVLMPVDTVVSSTLSTKSASTVWTELRRNPVSTASRSVSLRTAVLRMVSQIAPAYSSSMWSAMSARACSLRLTASYPSKPVIAA